MGAPRPSRVTPRRMCATSSGAWRTGSKARWPLLDLPEGQEISAPFARGRTALDAVVDHLVAGRQPAANDAARKAAHDIALADTALPAGRAAPARDLAEPRAHRAHRHRRGDPAPLRCVRLVLRARRPGRVRQSPPALRQPGRGAHRRAHRPRQPARADGRPRRALPRTTRPSRSCSRSSTSTASSSTTTASATRPATRCSTRLGERLTERASAASARAYRMGGDEFCVARAARPTAPRRRSCALAAERALRGRRGLLHRLLVRRRCCSRRRGDPTSSALRLADQRMYAAQGRRPRVGRAARAPTSCCSAARRAQPARWARTLERRRRRSPHGRRTRLGLAARRGRAHRASRPSCTTSARWRSPTRSSTSPARSTPTSGRSCAPHGDRRADHRAPRRRSPRVAELVRSSHERFDGTGYPDGLARRRDPARRAHHRRLRRLRRDGHRPPLPRRRSTPAARSPSCARCAGTQFDPAVVEAFASGVASVSDGRSEHSSGPAAPRHSRR